MARKPVSSSSDRQTIWIKTRDGGTIIAHNGKPTTKVK